MRSVTSMRGRSSAAIGSTSTPTTRFDAVVPFRLHAEERERLGEIVAAGAKRGRGPQIEHERARILAMILQVATHHLVGRALADDGRRACRHGARIDES